MPEQIARDRAGQLQGTRQARLSMRRAGEPLRCRCPCLGASDGSRLPARPRSGLGAVWTKQMLFSLQYTLFRPAVDAPVRDGRSVAFHDRSTAGVDGDRLLICLFASEVRIRLRQKGSNVVLTAAMARTPGHTRAALFRLDAGRLGAPRSFLDPGPMVAGAGRLAQRRRAGAALARSGQ